MLDRGARRQFDYFLAQDCPGVRFSAHAMDGDAALALVLVVDSEHRCRPAVPRQQGRVQIDGAPSRILEYSRGDQPGKACDADEIGLRRLQQSAPTGIRS